MTTEIAGKGIGDRIRISSTDPAVRSLLERVEVATRGRDCQKQGTSANTWWANAKTVAAVEELIAQ